MRKAKTLVEFVGGPVCGKVVDKTHLLGDSDFLPSRMVEAFGSPSQALVYVADVTRPTSARGAHRYVYAP